MKLTDREWKEFALGEIFYNNHGKRLTKQNRKLGNIPLLTASETQQGVSSFISNENMALYQDFISVDMFGHTFYHNYKCFGDDNIYFFINDKVSPQAKLFICACISQNKIKYSYGNQFRQDNADKDKVLLPVADNGQPDYQFMEKYIKEIIRTKRQEYINYARKIFKEVENTKQVEPLHNKNWKAFRITDIFPSIQRGKRLVKEKQIAGMIPYVSSTAMNNGVDNFIQYDERSMRKYNNCLSIANSGSVGSTFYEPFAFVASDHITHLKNKDFTQNIYLFIATLGNRLSQKYNFNREINDSRISREKIMLPTDDSGNPDYAYMEQYTKNMMIAKYNDYLQYVSNLQY